MIATDSLKELLSVSFLTLFISFLLVTFVEIFRHIFERLMEHDAR